MDYDQTITEIVEAIRADKSIVQPWRNKAIARAEEVQAFIRMGKTITRQEIPQGMCICPQGAYSLDCPQHSETAKRKMAGR